MVDKLRKYDYGRLCTYQECDRDTTGLLQAGHCRNDKPHPPTEVL
jgi:hypothetical protein